MAVLTSKVGPTTLPLKSSARFSLAPTTFQTKDSANSPRMSDCRKTLMVLTSLTDSRPLFGSKLKRLPNSVCGGSRQNSASIWPLLWISTSYWCRVLTYVSPTSSTS